MDIHNIDWEAQGREAQVEEIQIHYEAMRDMQTSKEELEAIAAGRAKRLVNTDEVAAANRLLALMAVNEQAGLSGEQLYLEHDDMPQ